MKVKDHLQYNNQWKKEAKMPGKAQCKMMVGPGKKYKTMSECLSYGGKKMGKMGKSKKKMGNPMKSGMSY